MASQNWLGIPAFSVDHWYENHMRIKLLDVNTLIWTICDGALVKAHVRSYIVSVIESHRVYANKNRIN